ncbi:MAG: sulfatase-like hydrolase/transferase [Xanthobacteraceae bacterium]|nr:sulfatase-like hydrolase/transferase [Xanthobacteraceae bacterium]
MSLSDLRNSRQFLALSSLSAKLRWRHVPLLLVHGVALGLMFLTEISPTGMLLFLFSWGFLNLLLIGLTGRPLVAGTLSLALILLIVVLSRFKFDVVWMTADFLDVILIDFATIAFLLTIYPNLIWLVIVLLAGLIILTVVTWRLDPHRVSRRIALAGCAGCLAGLITLSAATPNEWWESFSKDRFVSRFSRSAVMGISDLVTHGMFDADLKADGRLATEQPSCGSTAKLPHIVLIHDESSFDIRVAPGIKVPPGYGPHFLSFDGKARRLLVESHGGASWYAEFNVLTGLSSRSFGRFANFLPRLAAGRVKRGLPLSLQRCGYQSFSFYPSSSAFMSAKSFHQSTGFQHFYDYRDMGIKDFPPDSAYYDAAARIVQRDREAGRPMFMFVYLAYNHFPYMRRHPDLVPGWRDPGNTPEIDEYLRRQERGARDYQAFLQRLRRDFPGESFLLVRYGDHQPAFPTVIIDPTLDKAATARRIQAYDPRYMTTYYAIDVINYQPADLAPALELLDAPYIPLVIQKMIGLPLGPSFAEQNRIFRRCSGIFYACAAGAEVRRFNRLLLDAGQLERL